MATSDEWQQIYHNNLTGPPQPTVLRWSSGDVVTEATAVTSTTTATSSSTLSRVARPTNTRRRSRVSRRTPTTLLNTDTSNFRAMVQQFTGGNGGAGGGSQFMASGNSSIAPHQPLSSYNTTVSSGSDYYGTGLRISPPATGGYNVEFRQPQHQQYYSVVANKGGVDEYGFVQKVEEGGANIDSGDAIHGDKKTTFMF